MLLQPAHLSNTIFNQCDRSGPVGMIEGDAGLGAQHLAAPAHRRGRGGCVAPIEGSEPSRGGGDRYRPAASDLE